MTTKQHITLAICLLVLTACGGGAKHGAAGTESDRLYNEIMGN